MRGPLDRERLGAEAPKYLIGGRALIGRLLSAITSYPHASLHLNSPLVELVTVRRRRCRRRRRAARPSRAIRARAGVLLAAGGFENNPALRQRFGVPGDARDTMGAPGNTGLALAGRNGRRRRDRSDGSGVVVAGVHPSRRALGVLAVVHRRDLRQPGRETVRQRVRPLRPDRQSHHRPDRLRCNDVAVLDDLRRPGGPGAAGEGDQRVDGRARTVRRRRPVAHRGHTARTGGEDRCERRQPGVDGEAVQRVRRRGCRRGLRPG